MTKHLSLIIILALISISLENGTRPITVREMFQFKRLSSPAVSNDGKYTVYSIKIWNPVSGKASSYLEALYKTEDGSKKTFVLTDPTDESSTNSSAAFSPTFKDNMIFISNRSKTQQLWSFKFPTDDTLPTATQVTKYPISIGNVKWIGNTITFTADVYPDCTNLQCTATRDAEVEKRGSNTWGVYDNNMVRHWDTWDNQKVSHIFTQIVKLDTNKNIIPDGEPVDTMSTLNTYSPVPPFGGAEQYATNGDASEIVYTGLPRTKDEAWNTAWKVYYYKNDKTTDKLTEDIPARTQQPQFSPDGTMISYLAMDRKGSESDKLHFEIYTIATKEVRKIDTPDFDRSVEDYTWFDNNQIIFEAIDIGVKRLFSLNLDTSAVVPILTDSISSSIPIRVPGNTNTWLVARRAFTFPDELWTFKYDGTTVTELAALTQTNDLSQYYVSESEAVTFKGENNDDVYGWVFKPFNYKEGSTYPIVMLIHGGPESAWVQSWSFGWTPQLWASRGYGVIVINPHGSTGQGQKFTDAVINDWGGAPYRDLMTGFDTITSSHTWMDKNRACAAGGSYGGYMVNWIQGQTDRFKCLVTHSGVFSTLNMFYATEELWFPLREYCPLSKESCTPYDGENRDRFFQFNPESFVQNWKTPHIILHGSNDFRIPISEGISAYNALILKKVPARFVHFTTENHWILKAENSIKWFDEVFAWMDRWTKNKPDAIVTKKESLKYLQ